MTTAAKAVSILVVEDNHVDVNLIRYALEEVPDWPVEFHFVENGEDAFLFLEKEGRFEKAITPDLVLLDLNLPKRSGLEVLRLLKTVPALLNVRVVVLSSSPIDIIKHRVRDVHLSPDCCFTKPLGLDEFLALGDKIRKCYQGIDTL